MFAHALHCCFAHFMGPLEFIVLLLLLMMAVHKLLATTLGELVEVIEDCAVVAGIGTLAAGEDMVKLWGGSSKSKIWACFVMSFFIAVSTLRFRLVSKPVKSKWGITGINRNMYLSFWIGVMAKSNWGCVRRGGRSVKVKDSSAAEGCRHIEFAVNVAFSARYTTQTL